MKKSTNPEAPVQNLDTRSTTSTENIQRLLRPYRLKASAIKTAWRRQKALEACDAYEGAVFLSGLPDPARSARWKVIAAEKLAILQKLLDWED